MGAGDWAPETIVLGVLSTEDNVDVDAAEVSNAGRGEAALPSASE